MKTSIYGLCALLVLFFYVVDWNKKIKYYNELERQSQAAEQELGLTRLALQRANEELPKVRKRYEEARQVHQKNLEAAGTWFHSAKDLEKSAIDRGLQVPLSYGGSDGGALEILVQGDRVALWDWVGWLTSDLSPVVFDKVIMGRDLDANGVVWEARLSFTPISQKADPEVDSNDSL
jgi:hypothetical protein